MSNELLAGQHLVAGEFLTAQNSKYNLIYQHDGNLVLYKYYKNQPAKPLWASNTAGHTTGQTVMQHDGNLVIYDVNGSPLWASNTQTHNSRVVIQDDGNLVVYSSPGNAIWATDTSGQTFAPTGPVAQGDAMQPGEVLNPDQVINSLDGEFFLVYQTDGNLVLYRNPDGTPIWASNTSGNPAEVCIMQNDGNLVIYDGDGTPLWASNTSGNPGSNLVLQDDANAVIYQPNGNPIWATNTAQPIRDSTIEWPWAIILCRFNDVPTIPHQRNYYVDLFTRNGTGGVCDYWRSVSFNSLDLTKSEVFGWFTMNHSSAEASRLRFPADRSTLVEWGKDAAIANGVSLSNFKQILVVQNLGFDHGAANNGIVIVDQNPTQCEFGFICHEMGHGFGLPHSFSANPDREYGDGWDLMSFQTTTFQFPISFQGTQGTATVGLNARNLEALNAVPVGRRWVRTQPDFSERITLEPLNQSPIGNQGFLLAKITPYATRPKRPNSSSFTIECHRRAGWDQGIPQDAVIVHEVRTDGKSYLHPSVGGQFTTGQIFVTPTPEIFIKVESIDRTSGTTTVRLWDLVEAGLRREDSKPRVYLIENGKKRWVTSPQVLFRLGKTWADVKVVPDGALNNIQVGQDIV